MSLIAIPVVVAIVGALVYGISANGKVQQLALVMFLCGLLVALFALGSEKIRIP